MYQIGTLLLYVFGFSSKNTFINNPVIFKSTNIKPTQAWTRSVTQHAPGAVGGGFSTVARTVTFSTNGDIKLGAYNGAMSAIDATIIVANYTVD